MDGKAIPSEAVANPAGSRRTVASNSMRASTGEGVYDLHQQLSWVEAVRDAVGMSNCSLSGFINRQGNGIRFLKARSVLQVTTSARAS